jgi:ElaB/YqjD/DUF883 family membrane-anchored ribosome-binding protein
MNKHIQAISNDVGMLAQDAGALMAATAHVAEEKVVAASKRVGVALNDGNKILGRVRDKAVEGARAADRTVRANPYQVFGIAFGLGALIGLLLRSRNGNRSRDAVNGTFSGTLPLDESN